MCSVQRSEVPGISATAGQEHSRHQHQMVCSYPEQTAAGQEHSRHQHQTVCGYPEQTAAGQERSRHQHQTVCGYSEQTAGLPTALSRCMVTWRARRPPVPSSEPDDLLFRAQSPTTSCSELQIRRHRHLFRAQSLPARLFRAQSPPARR